MNEKSNKPDYTGKIYYLLKSKFDENYEDLNKLSSFFVVFGVIALFFSGGDSSYQYIWYLIAMVVMFIMIVFNAVKAIYPLEQFLKIPMTKFLLSIFFTTTVVYSAAQVNIKLNEIFYISGSNFKYGVFFGSIIYFVNHIVSILLYIVALIIFYIFFDYIVDAYKTEKLEYGGEKSYWKFEFNKKLWYLIVFLLYMLGLWHLNNVALDNKSINYKLFILAVKFDFDSKHRCSNVEDYYSVIYIDPSKERVLVNTSFTIDKSIFGNNKENINAFNQRINSYRERFVVKECQYEKN
ncbi:hypothetical protein [Acinetobacter populi]|uniref:Uncharacterized protein n=1 Tax=Acinetobacter populi TaxID=1582270 RepID=A0A1Z9YZ61_9GAMM|nr:hypothetical protein [Acinetobacter populi]OUY07503.1 hypothetical protein CAP51_07045 [Acinetobacter populi]